MSKSGLEDIFANHIRALGLPEPAREYRFAAYAVGGPGQGVRARLAEAGLRDWRLDFAWPDCRLAVAIQGGIWNRGRHVRGAGYAEDCRKYNAALLLGWRVLQFTGGMVRDGTAARLTEQLLDQFCKS